MEPNNAFIPNDELYSNQWHLQNTGQTGGKAGVDTNVLPAWESVVGKGVVIGIVDNGVVADHPDLAEQYRRDLSFDFLDNDADPSPDTESHGTSIADKAARKIDNKIGNTNFAPEAEIANLRLVNDSLTLQSAEDFDAATNKALSFKNQEIDIYNNSWVPSLITDFIKPVNALEKGVTQGRNGLGSIFVFSSGNDELTPEDEDVNRNGYANSRYTIAVGSVNDKGQESDFSIQGAPLLISAPGEAITTTTDSSGYINEFGGTSASAPVVSGVIALMLEANPKLAWRDVQAILVQTAEKNDPNDEAWQTNGAGLSINHKFGFGMVDAAAAVSAAKNWQALGEEVAIRSSTIAVNEQLPDDDATGFTSTFTV